jgi:DNA helicase II / ATP-dependent DNA helicase PcrA
MPITPPQILSAQGAQHAAAHDGAQKIRLLAGPGTGKSSSIEKRVHWLLSNGTEPDQIVAVSFTRASAADLERRIRAYCHGNGQPQVEQVRVCTLHSVALRLLRQAGLLEAFPVEPRVLDEWERRDIFDVEFGKMASIPKKRRREAIRRAHEAFWSAGIWNPANYIPPVPPITEEERNSFQAFLTSRGQLYACVLPGELVRRCVDAAHAGLIDLQELLGISHLIVDEFQDLNRCDLEFVRLIASDPVNLFAAGDDDQSIYSFRFASPAGIQRFNDTYPNASARSLTDCFRCTPTILETAYQVVKAYPDPLRLQKQVLSLYEHAAPPVTGMVARWRFASCEAEANAIAASCRDLIISGMAANQIMILLSSVPTLGRVLTKALQEAGVPFQPLRPTPFCDTPIGRIGLALLRIVSDPDDYLALRTILGLLPGVGVNTCIAVASSVHNENLNYRDVFIEPLPGGVFTGRPLAALQAAREVVSVIQGWHADDLFGERRDALKTIVGSVFAHEGFMIWSETTDFLRDEMTLLEVQKWLTAPSENERQRVLLRFSARIGEIQGEAEPLESNVQLRTMHSAKGLSAQVVFIPGLEESLLPGPKRAPYAGLVSEAARLLFVSITRARAACILSFARHRLSQGTIKQQIPSRFCHHLGGAFVTQANGLNAHEVINVIDCIASL